MTIEMEKLERKHYLKHYQGGFGMVLQDGIAVTGQIEEVDMEDGSILIHSGERSQWVEGNSVTPSLKHAKDITLDDLSTVVNNLIFYGRKLDIRKWDLVYRKYSDRIEVDVNVPTLFTTVIIYNNWSIVTSHNVLPDNIGSIIFLLCELGYNVAPDIFKP
jgi:hypothetical protein